MYGRDGSSGFYTRSVSSLTNDDLAQLQPRPSKVQILTEPTQKFPTSSLQHKSWQHDVSFSQVSRSQPAPRLAGRLKELELGSLLALCSRLEGRLEASRTNAATTVASDEELDFLVDDLAGPDVRSQMSRHRQSAARPPTMSPPVNTTSEAALDGLLIELNSLLHAASTAAIGSRTGEVSTARPALSPTASVENEVPQSRLAEAPVYASPTMAHPTLPDKALETQALASESFSEALASIRSMLVKLADIHRAEVIRAANNLPEENLRLLEELQRDRDSKQLRETFSSDSENVHLKKQAEEAVQLMRELKEKNESLLEELQRSDCSHPETTSPPAFSAENVRLKKQAEEAAQQMRELKQKNESLMAEIARLQLQQVDLTPRRVSLSLTPSSSLEDKLRKAGRPKAQMPWDLETNLPGQVSDDGCQTEAFRASAQEAATSTYEKVLWKPALVDHQTQTQPMRSLQSSGRVVDHQTQTNPSPAASSNLPVPVQSKEDVLTPREDERLKLREAWSSSLEPGEASWGEDADELARLAKFDQQTCSQMHELSTGRLVWDTLGLLLLLYDIIATPVNLAFGEQNAQLCEVMRYVFPAFWFLEIILTSFFTTFSQGGVTQRSRKAALKRYATSWLPLDVLSTSLDVLFLEFAFSVDDAIFTLIQNKIHEKAIYSGLQAIRLLRTIRILRNSRCIMVRVQDELFRSLIGLVSILVASIIGAHVVACGMCHLGSARGVDPDTWLEEYVGDSTDKGTIYLIALLWAFSQLTPGAGPSLANPRSVPDLFYSIGAHVLALIALMWLFATATGISQRLRQRYADLRRRQILVRRYIGSGARISAQMKLHLLSWTDLEPSPRLGYQVSSPLEVLPPYLRQELSRELCTPLLFTHPFFKELNLAHPQAMQQVLRCMSQLFFEPGKDIFTPGVVASQMYFVAQGKVVYTVSNKATVAQTIPRGRHVAEASLWLQNYSYRGQLTAEGFSREICEIWSMDAMSFAQRLLAGPWELWKATSNYAEAFARRVNEISDVDTDYATLLKLTEEAFTDAASGEVTITEDLEQQSQS